MVYRRLVFIPRRATVDESLGVAASYRRSLGISTSRKDGVAPYSALIARDTQPNPNRGSKKLLDRFHDKMRSLHYALATENSYRHWIVEFLRFHRECGRWRHPTDMGKPEIEAFLTHLATDRNVAAKTQNQAFWAILFLYKQVLDIELPTIDALRAKERRRLPVVLSQEEVARLIVYVDGGGGLYRLMVELTYGAGLRLLECCRLRVKDVDFGRRQLIVREGKGDKDIRVFSRPDKLKAWCEKNDVDFEERKHLIIDPERRPRNDVNHRGLHTLAPSFGQRNLRIHVIVFHGSLDHVALWASDLAS